MSPAGQMLLDSDAIARSVRRIAMEIVDSSRGTGQLGLVGIRKGGGPLAEWIGREIRQREQREVPVGGIDITFYRDDAASMLPDPEVGPSDIPFDVRGWDVVLVDDVLHTGRTVRAAIECLLDHGRPRRIWLAVLCDRGDRELPMSADFVGRAVEVADDHVIDVIANGGSDDCAVVRPIVPGAP